MTGIGRRPAAGASLWAGDAGRCQVGRDDSGFVAVATAGLILVLVSLAALLAALDPDLDEDVLRASVSDGPAVDGVTRAATLTVDGLGAPVHRAKLLAIRAAMNS